MGRRPVVSIPKRGRSKVKHDAALRTRVEVDANKSRGRRNSSELLYETAEHHDHYEKTHAEHHWWDWYASYLSARQNGISPEEAAAAADRYMEAFTT